MRIAINGFGRIGRVFLRSLLSDKKNKNIKVIAINDRSEASILSHLFKYDSIHGKFNGTVSHTKNSIKVNGNNIQVLNEMDPSKLSWKKLNIDYVIECTGKFLTKELASKHIQAGAKKVILSAPPKDPKIKEVCYGINHKTIKKSDKIISNASCTTNCMAPIVKIIDDKLKINKAYMLTVHAMTNTQKIMDSSNKDPRRSRSAVNNLIPTSTGFTKAIVEIFPKLKGKIDGMAVRAPVIDGSLIDFVVNTKKSTNIEELNKLFLNASKSSMKEILEYSTEELVSTDIIGNSKSCVFDSK